MRGQWEGRLLCKWKGIELGFLEDVVFELSVVRQV